MNNAGHTCTVAYCSTCSFNSTAFR